MHSKIVVLPQFFFAVCFSVNFLEIAFSDQFEGSCGRRALDVKFLILEVMVKISWTFSFAFLIAGHAIAGVH